MNAAALFASGPLNSQGSEHTALTQTPLTLSLSLSHPYRTAHFSSSGVSLSFSPGHAKMHGKSTQESHTNTTSVSPFLHLLISN